MPTTFRTYNGSNANHNFGASIGIYFTVAAGKSVRVTELGAFASGGVGVPAGVTITVSLVNRASSTTLLAQTTFTNASQGTVDATNRVMTKSVTPVTLPAGDYCVWAYGYGATYQAYNSSQTTPGSSPVTSTLGGVITLGNDYYKLAGAVTMPDQDGGAAKFGGPSMTAEVVSATTETNMTLDSTTPTNVTSSAWTQIAAAGKTVFVQAQKNAVYLRAKNTTPTETTGFILQPVDLANAQRDTGGTPAVTYTLNTGIQLYARAVDRDAIVCVMSD